LERKLRPGSNPGVGTIRLARGSRNCVGVAMIKGAKNPNAARLFMDHMLSEEVQLSFARSATRSIKGLDSKVPEKWKFSVYGKLLGHADIDKQAERLKLASEIYNRR
jgi:iron(III) transport system substrate-binding protein